MIKCLIVDDEVTARNILKRYIADVKSLVLVGECKNAIGALEFMADNTIDLLFLDIEMPKLSGLEFLRTLNSRPNVIITTAFREFAVEGFEFNVVDYLLKPISFERFLTSINKINQISITPESNEREYTYFKSGKINVQVYFDNILFVEGLGNYVKIHVSDSPVITTYESLTDIMKLLPLNQFERIHRSYIISIKKIKAYGSDYVEIEDYQLSIGNTYRDSFFRRMSEIK